MDANQTRFHLMLGRDNWSACRLPPPDGGAILAAAQSPLQWDEARHELRLRAEPYLFKAATRDERPAEASRRGAAADGQNNWYWIAEDRAEIRAHSSGDAGPGHFWSATDTPPARRRRAVFQPAVPAAAPRARALSGLVVTEDQHLVVGTLDPGGLLVFDLLGGGPPRPLVWPVGFAPTDMIARPGGGVWILDAAQGRYWGLDRTLRVLTAGQVPATLAAAGTEVFQPETGAPRVREACLFPTGLELMQGSPIQAITPVAIEALPDGTVLILDAPAGKPSRVLRYSFATPRGAVQLDFAAFDFALAGDQLFIVSAEGNQSMAFTLGDLAGELTLTRLDKFWPMRRFGGKALVAAGGRAYYDFGERWIPLVDQSRPRFVTSATLETRSLQPGSPGTGFDGREPQCVWHRLLLDATLPAGAEIKIWSRAADEEAALAITPWEPEPGPYRRSGGSELPFASAPESADRGTYELLFQRARGRYLQLKLQFSGNGRVTPRLRAMRVYYPRFSYLEHYLPAVYRADANSAAFLERFLANLEGTNTAIEDRIAAVQMLFDLRSAPGDTLDWLASWFGVVLDPAWDETRRRLFLAHAMDFFQWRGTVGGLKMALRLTFDESPSACLFDPPAPSGRGDTGYRIVERFLTRQTPAVELGDPGELPAGPGLVPAGGTWKPEHGAAALEARFATATRLTGFSFAPRADAAEETARAAFAQRELRFVPSDPTDDIAAWSDYAQSKGRAGPTSLPDDEPANATAAGHWQAYQIFSDSQPYGRQRRLWQQFLARRYVSITALNRAHATGWTGFEGVAYPAALPANIPRLQDWFEFEAHVLPMLASAHRFSVLLPVKRNTATTDDDRRRQLALASRLVELEKPAHTTFDVRFFWALFRVGEARLGTDSVLGLGGRDPALRPDVVLGDHYLGESFVATSHPPSRRGRIVLGRDSLQCPPLNPP